MNIHQWVKSAVTDDFIEGRLFKKEFEKLAVGKISTLYKVIHISRVIPVLPNY